MLVFDGKVERVTRGERVEYLPLELGPDYNHMMRECPLCQKQYCRGTAYAHICEPARGEDGALVLQL